MTIRQERPSDYPEVYALVSLSFATASHGDGTEADYLNAVREKDSFIPALSLVAEGENGKLIGQVVLYKTDITTQQGPVTELLLSPICVHPGWFRRGIARALIEEACKRAKEMGYRAVFLCGDPAVYQTLGFQPSCAYEIFHVEDASKSAEWSMVRELFHGALTGITGTIHTQ